MTTEITTTLEPVEPGDFKLVDEPMFAKVYITTVVIGAYQPRQTFNDETLQELAASIKKFGINQPLLFRPAPGNPEMLELVAGERRFRAAIIAGLEWVPGMVKTLTDQDTAAFRLVENMQREDVPPLEEAQGIKRLMDDFGFSVEAIAEQTGKKKGVIYASLKLLNLSPAAQDMVKDKHVAASTALLVARIPVPALQEQAMKEIIHNSGAAEPMSQRAAKQHIEDRYMLDLSQAEFSLEDRKLVKNCGGCQECPKRTINSPEDFPGVTADLCTDPDCFGLKVAAHHKAVIAGALKKKITVYSCRSDASTDGFPPSHYVSRENTRMSQFNRLVARSVSSSVLLKDSELANSDYPVPAAYYMEGEKPIALYLKADIQNALEKAGLARTLEQEAAPSSIAPQQGEDTVSEPHSQPKADRSGLKRTMIQEANDKIAAAYNDFHQDLFEEIKEVISDEVVPSIYRELAAFSICAAAKGFELSLPQRVDESYSVDLQDTSAVMEMVERASELDVCRLYLDAILSVIPRVYQGEVENGVIKCDDEWDTWNFHHFTTLAKIAGICGIDVGLLRDKHLAAPLQALAHAMAPASEEPAADTTDTPAPKVAKKQPARPKKTTKTPATAPDSAWPFPKSKEGA